MILSSVPGRAELDSPARRGRGRARAQARRTARGEDELVELAGEVARAARAHRSLRSLLRRARGARDPRRPRLCARRRAPRHRRVLRRLEDARRAAGLLFQRPDVLLLDEPTNHLDLPSVAWFSEFLKAWRGCFVLDQPRPRVLERADRARRRRSSSRAAQLPGQLRAATSRSAPKKRRSCKGRAKNLARERERLREVRQSVPRAGEQGARGAVARQGAREDGERRDVRQARHDAVRVPGRPRSRRRVVEIDGLTKAYGEHVVFAAASSLTVRRGEKIGIIGVNGAGKTTLLRMIAGELPHDAGTIKLGSGVKVGYYAQHHADTLDMTATVVRDRRSARHPSVARTRALDLRRVHVLGRRRRQAVQGAVGRRARARRAREAVRLAGKSPAHGRADEPPRSRGRRGARASRWRRSTARSCSSATTAR